MPRQIEVKAQILKFIEIAYKEDKGFTTKLMVGKSLKLAVDDKGKVTLAGEKGVLKFEVSKSAIEEFGIKLKAVSVTFKSNSNGTLKYTGSVSLAGIAHFGVTGEINIRELVEQCEWGLCKYRFKPDEIDAKLRQMGVEL